MKRLFTQRTKTKKKREIEWIHCVEYIQQKDDLSDLEVAFIQFAFERGKLSKSQLAQDIFVEFILRKRNGFFCEFGATDGVSLSNTFYLESELGWTGVLAEPAKRWHSALRKNRPNSIIDTRCVYNSSGDLVTFNEAERGELSTIESFSDSDHFHKKRKSGIRYDVATITLNDLLYENRAENIDYLSVDTEGSEYPILQEFDIQRFNPAIITVEHNFGEDRDSVKKLLNDAGYQRVFEKLSMFDDWFIHRSVSEQIGV